MDERKQKLYTLRNFAEKYSEAFTVSSLRWLRFHEQSNGFEGAFLKVGKKLLVDEDVFFECLRRNNRRPPRGDLAALSR